jgi:hypothetical protein
MTCPLQAPYTTALLATAVRIAKACVVADVESSADLHIMSDGSTWWDLSPMLSPQEHSAEVLDMASETIAFGLAAGCLRQHPCMPHLVRVVADAAAHQPTTPYL